MDLPNFDVKEEDAENPDTQRSFFKERGLQPIRPWHEKPFKVQSLHGVIDQYVPPEGDGKLSPLNSAVRWRSTVLTASSSTVNVRILTVNSVLGCKTKIRMVKKERQIMERFANYS